MDRLPQAIASTLERPMSPAQKRLAIGLTMSLLAVGVVLTPLANTPLIPIPGFMTAYGAAMLVANLLLAALLFSRGATEGRTATIVLGSAYFFVAAIFVPLMAAFPNGLMPGSLIGSTVSPVWLWSFWHAGFGLAILRYAAMQSRGRAPTRVAHEVLGTLAVVGLLAWLATLGLGWLPPLLSNGKTFFAGGQQIIPYGILAIDLAALLLITRLPRLAPEQVWLAVGMVAACVDVWLTFQGTDRFSLGWYVSKLCSLATTLTVLVSLFHELTALYRRVSEANALLASMAHQDGLTGLANRRRFDEVLAAEWTRAGRGHLPMALLMIDVDFFKNFNDRYGHAEGDHCLRQVADLARACARRPGDVVARYGGEEFALVLPDTDGDGAQTVAALLRSELAALAVPHAAAPLGRVSISVGIAIWRGPQAQQGTSPQDLLRAADAALYRAKAGGRDQACLAPEMATEAASGTLPAERGTEGLPLAMPLA